MKNSSLLVHFALLSFFYLGPLLAHANVSGSARVIDGDTIDIEGQVIRLYGIDAPENGQHCKAGKGKSYSCGVDSQSFLRSIIGAKVTCSGREFDAYERLLGICRSNGVELNREMVRTGHAVAYRKYANDYIKEEIEASRSRRGLWAGEFIMPWDFRAQQWTASAASAPVSNCPIKGNINRKGERIYHAPWSNSYARTKINTANSERWFCSEAEALAAGWRAPRQ